MTICLVQGIRTVSKNLWGLPCLYCNFEPALLMWKSEKLTLSRSENNFTLKEWNFTLIEWISTLKRLL